MVDGFDSDGLPARLCSQRFYDDCHEMLQPGGIMVANLHFGHRHYARHLDRIRCSFDGAVLVVDDSELSNSIVFAVQGRGLRRGARRRGAARPRDWIARPASSCWARSRASIVRCGTATRLDPPLGQHTRSGTM